MAASGRLRIIGGQWRGRKLTFAPLEGLRPTPDRVRETLFNWLGPRLPGARCLDLFAGSGALGLEALSRGAGEVVFVERHPTVVRQLQDNLILLGGSGGRVVHDDALAWLERQSPLAYDIVLLDPPFALGLLSQVCSRLENRGWLAPRARIYLESDPAAQVTLPDNWTILREKRAGQVRYRLAVRESTDTAA